MDDDKLMDYFIEVKSQNDYLRYKLKQQKQKREELQNKIQDLRQDLAEREANEIR